MEETDDWFKEGGCPESSKVEKDTLPVKTTGFCHTPVLCFPGTGYSVQTKIKTYTCIELVGWDTTEMQKFC